MRRVVVTGLGVVSPLGLGAEHSFSQLLAGRSGISCLDRFDVSDLPTKIAGQVPRGSEPWQYDALRFANAKELRRYDEFILFALAAADEAMADSGWTPTSDEARERAGVLIGSGIGGLPSIAENAVKLEQEGPRRISPYFIPGSLINEASGVVSIRHGLKGPNHAVLTACATGAHALGDAGRLIALGDASYSIYLLHMFGVAASLKAVSNLLPGYYWLSVVVAAFAGVVLGLLAHRIADAPIVSHFAKKRRAVGGLDGLQQVGAGGMSDRERWRQI